MSSPRINECNYQETQYDYEWMQVRKELEKIYDLALVKLNSEVEKVNMITEDAKSMSSLSSDDFGEKCLNKTNEKKSKVIMEKDQLDIRVTTDIPYS